jgi:hypothetical protein
MKKPNKTYNKGKSMRVSDEVWAWFSSTKPNGISWEQHLRSLMELMKHFNIK